jgi:hypothetical protein
MRQPYDSVCLQRKVLSEYAKTGFSCLAVHRLNWMILQQFV